MTEYILIEGCMCTVQSKYNMKYNICSMSLAMFGYRLMGFSKRTERTDWQTEDD